MAFGDYANTFSSLGSASFPASFAFGSNAPNFSFGGGAKTGMDPFTAILGVGQLGASIFGGLAGQNAAARSLQAQFDAQKAGTEAGARIAREQAYGQLGENIANRIFGATIAPELEFGRQLKAKEFELGPLAEKGFGVASEASRRQRLAEISPERQAAQRFENLLNMKREQANREGAMAAMFGPKAPTDISRMVV
jgi:hypothetical protein